MKKRLLLAFLLLTGCYAAAQPMFLPDGTSGYRISCDTSLSNPMDCIQKAGDLCGANGYQMYDASGHLKNEDTENQTIIAAVNNSGAPAAAKTLKPVVTTSSKSMFIKCRSMDMPLRLTPAANPGPVESTSTTLQTPTLSSTKPIPLHNSNINPAPAQ